MCTRNLGFTLPLKSLSLKRFLIGFFLFCNSTGFATAQDLLTLKEALKIGLENNPEVKAARSELDMAKESNTYGNAGFLPQVNLNSGRAFQWNDIRQQFANGLVVDRGGVATNQFSAGLSLNWTLYDGGPMFLVKKRQDATVSAADLKWQNQILSLTDSISTAYYQLVLAGMELRLTTEEETLVSERLKMAAEQFRLGLRPKSDLLLAQIDHNRVRNKISNQQKQLEIRKGNFNLLLGRGPETGFNTVDSVSTVNPADFQEFKARVLGQNLMLRYQKQNLEIAKINVKQLKSRALPQITLNSAYNFNQTRNQAGFALFNRSAGPNIGLSLSMPLFQGMSTSRLHRLGNMDLGIRELQLRSIENRIINQIWRLVKSIEIQMETLESESRIVALATENALIVKSRFALGQSNSLEMKDAEYQLTAAQNRWIQARYQAKIFEIQLLRYAGELKLQ
jgi:outer membrane protein TolC